MVSYELLSSGDRSIFLDVYEDLIKSLDDETH